jgi:hypothetical protein
VCLRHHSAFFSLAFRLLNVSGVSAGSSRRQQDHTGESGLRLATRGWSDGRTGGARWWCGLVVRELWRTKGKLRHRSTLPRPSRIWQSRLASAADELRSGRKFSPSNQRPSASWASTMVPQQLSIPAPVSNRPPSPNLLPLGSPSQPSSTASLTSGCVLPLDPRPDPSPLKA